MSKSKGLWDPSSMPPGQKTLFDLFDESESDSTTSAYSNSFIDRIYDLAEKKGVSIGDLEAFGGVSKGYLSRLRKNGDAEGTIGAKTLLKFAEKLEVPIEYFYQEDTEELTQSEDKVLKFLQKVREDTAAGRMDWERDDYKWLKKMDGADAIDFEQDGIKLHPLYNVIPGPEILAYNSMLRKDIGYSPAGNFYHAWLSKQQVNLYIAKVIRDDGENSNSPVYEFYFVSNPTKEDKFPKPQPICSTELSRGIFKTVAEKIYLVAEEASTHIMINDNVSKLLDSFLDESGKEAD